MKSSSALFLQGILVLMGVGALGFLLWEPHVEGRNAHATTFEIYCKDPFLAYVYVSSIPFFVALYRAHALLGDFRENQGFSSKTVDALRVVKRCGMTLIGFVMIGVVIILISGDKDDRPAGFFMSALVAFAASAIAGVAALFERNMQSILRRADRRGEAAD